jgi:hypothetical protein
MPRMTLGPRPSLEIEEPSGTDHGAIGNPNRGKRDGSAGTASFNGRGDVLPSCRSALGNGRPSVKRWISRRRDCQSTDMVKAQGLKADKLSG